MSKITQVRLSGYGGQGIVLAGLLLGQAGSINGKHVTGSSSYGVQARGSGCKSEVIFSDRSIDFPHLTVADILVVMSQRAYDDFYRDVKADSGLIFYDQGQIVPKESLRVKQIGIPATEYAIKKLKNGQVAIIIVLGALLENTDIVTVEAIREAIHTHVSKRFLPINLKALRIGMELGRPANG
jgi:2-oxoglutarate ferredoxin oxidoreductase subunit gamma